MALGEILRNARMQKGLTPSEVAENTRMMVQVVECLEREDFRRIAAPIYGRGFIKLYAELLELDPEPLIRDFMELYDGARAPAVKTRSMEPSEPPVQHAPVTRTVSGPAPLAPQRQAVQPRPAIRPLPAEPVHVAQSDSPQEKPPVKPTVAEIQPDASPASDEMGAAVPREPKQASRLTGFVVEPEAALFESDEPDLFNPAPPRRQPEADRPKSEGLRSDGDTVDHNEQKLPVFKIGGRLQITDAAEPRDEEVHARRHAKIEKFLEGFAKLKDGVERKLPGTLPRKQVLALGGFGVLALLFMAVGISVLFKMTGSNVKAEPNVVIERVAPPPALYVD